MLSRLTKAMRLKAASVLVLLYTFCILAPAAAFAFGDGSRAAHCLTDDNHYLRPAHVHQHDDGKSHVHKAGTIHERSKAPHEHGKSSDLQCCGLVCLTALTAALTEIHAPALPMTLATSANQKGVSGRAPDRLYRPPISLPSL